MARAFTDADLVARFGPRRESSPDDETHARRLYAWLRENSMVPVHTTCEACGAHAGDRLPPPRRPVRIIAHHPDLVGAPAQTLGLCDSCHQKVHLGMIPEPGTGRIYTEGHGKYGPLPRLEASRQRAATATRRRTSTLALPSAPRASVMEQRREAARAAIAARKES